MIVVPNPARRTVFSSKRYDAPSRGAKFVHVVSTPMFCGMLPYPATSTVLFDGS